MSRFTLLSLPLLAGLCVCLGGCQSWRDWSNSGWQSIAQPAEGTAVGYRIDKDGGHYFGTWYSLPAGATKLSQATHESKLQDCRYKKNTFTATATDAAGKTVEVKISYTDHGEEEDVSIVNAHDDILNVPLTFKKYKK